ncbi:MAG: toxin-antitoxin system YwqK family antitoxin [Rhodospirillaceae bacterium]|jgi:antitoxin component YwqK of YwqJK toxin-antitoxin module|nr:toxin-antitoxin system YwqK family antitoxin [Rhodospirillaceae bacterium]
MKRFLAPILLLTFLFPSIALGEGVKLEDLVRRDGLYYERFTDVPFTGKTRGIEQGTIKRGKIEGSWARYRHDGTLITRATYKDDILDGPYATYHRNGQVLERGTFKNGKREGPWVGYHENGEIWTKRTYKDGKLDGPFFEYWDDGTLDEQYSGTYKDGVKVK